MNAIRVYCIVVAAIFLMVGAAQTFPVASAEATEPGSEALLLFARLIGDYAHESMTLKGWQITNEADPVDDYYLGSLTVTQEALDVTFNDLIFWHRWGWASLNTPMPEWFEADPGSGQVGNIDVTYTVGLSGDNPVLMISWTNHIQGSWTFSTGYYDVRCCRARLLTFNWDPSNGGDDFSKMSTGSGAYVQDGHTYYYAGRVFVTTTLWDWGCLCTHRWDDDTGYQEFSLSDNN